MLQSLYIQNYAIIDGLEITFQNGLNIITGETGAGKSIVMGALGLILGDRADTSVLLNKDKKSIIEGKFSAGNNNRMLQQLFRDNELEWDTELVFRREIAASGKSRSFVNDTPVTLQLLRQLSVHLIDLHRQFDTLELGEADFQLEILDAVADNGELLQQYRSSYHAHCTAKKEWQTLLEQQQQANRELDYNTFLFEELDEAAFQENELEALDEELKMLSNSEHIRQQLQLVTGGLINDEQPLVQQLKMLVQKLQGIEKFHPELPVLSQRLLSAHTELKDISEELERINETVQYNPERIEWINNRTGLGYRLLKKHGVSSTSELRAIQADLSGKLDRIHHIGNRIAAKEKETETLHQTAAELAEKLGTRRKKAATPFARQVNELLRQVGMPNAQLKVELTETGKLNENGSGELHFLFDANSHNRFEPIQKVASGGELSRLMLCIKSRVAQKAQLPTLIFDEIDTGISGEAARQVGIIMQSLSAGHQLITITHQPQIAAKAAAHYFVYKEIKGDRIATSVKKLSNDERITAIAKMLSGEKPTAAALENAREMVQN